MSQWALLAAVVVLIVAVAVSLLNRRKTTEVWSLAPKEILSARERDLHRLLLLQYPDQPIFAKVPLSQLMDVMPESASRELIRSHLKKHVAAFVLCRADYTVMAVIDLDDGARFSPGTQSQEAKTAKALQSAGLRLVRIPPGPLPEGSDLQLLIEGDGFLFLSPTVPKWRPLSA